jgi:hypothetical protein
VRGVIFSATRAGSMFIVRGSTSAGTGVAPVWMMELNLRT